MADEEKDTSTDFLFAQPSRWSGLARLLDLWGKFDAYNTSESPEEADMWALFSDWRITGQDIRDAWRSVHSAKSTTDDSSTKSVIYACPFCGKKAESSDKPSPSMPKRKPILGKMHATRER